MASLKGKVALITGASSGIGKGAAVHFASLGCRLSLHGRNEENLRQVAIECEATGLSKEQIFLVLGDLTDEKEIEKVMQETINHFSQLDVLVNNAGIVKPGTVESQTLADFDLQMNINTRAYFYMSKLAVPHLTKTKGTIVNVSSITGPRSFPGVVGYCVSKAAVDQLTRCSALDLASKGIRVNAVCPGVIITEVHKRGGMDNETYAKFLEHCKETHALGRVGTVDEVAKSIAFLASDDASFITGATLPIDGGRGSMCPR